MGRKILRTRFSPPDQDGAVLLILVVLLVITMSGALMTALSLNNNKLDKSFVNAKALAQAKVALIAHARLSDPLKTLPPAGLQQRYLPCPDLDGDGVEESPCGVGDVAGWLPWQTLGIKPLRDASGNCLRYYIGGPYKLGALLPPLITALPIASFVIRDDAGGVVSNDAVAVIFAPNEPIAGQTRDIAPGITTECGSTVIAAPINQNSNLLDSIGGINNATPPQFVTAPKQIGPTTNLNDTMVWIDRSEL